MTSKELISQIDSHIDHLVACILQESEFKDALRTGVAKLVTKEVTADYAAKTLRRLVAAKLAQLQAPKAGTGHNEPQATA